MTRFSKAAAALAVVLLLPPAVAASPALPLVWPEVDLLPAIERSEVTVASSTPFTLDDVGDPDAAPPVALRLDVAMPVGASAERPVPAVVLLHGSAGVLPAREEVYARQLAAMGVAAVVVRSFESRRDIATAFVDRLLHITEAAMLADAHAALGWLDARPEVDGSRVVLMGFSYGGMATLYAVQRQVAETYLPDGPRFAAHVAFYAPCIARFVDAATTGAPVLMLAGDRDAIVDERRCDEAAQALEAGGSHVERLVYEGAYHQWDGSREGPRAIGRNLAPCSFVVQADGDVHDGRTGMPMTGPFMRKVILGLCSGSEGYLMGRDDAVRARAVADVARFLNRVFDGG